MQNKTNQICKAVMYITTLIAWVSIFAFLVIIGPPIWGVLQITATVIVTLAYINKTGKYKKLKAKIEELEKRIEELEKNR